MTLLNPSSDFDDAYDLEYEDSIALEHLYPRIRKWMRRAGGRLTYHLYSIEAKCRNKSDDWGVFDKRVMVVYALSSEHASSLCHDDLFDGMGVERQVICEEVNLHALHARPFICGTSF